MRLPSLRSLLLLLVLIGLADLLHLFFFSSSSVQFDSTLPLLRPGIRDEKPYERIAPAAPVGASWARRQAPAAVLEGHKDSTQNSLSSSLLRLFQTTSTVENRRDEQMRAGQVKTVTPDAKARLGHAKPLQAGDSDVELHTPLPGVRLWRRVDDEQAAGAGVQVPDAAKHNKLPFLQHIEDLHKDVLRAGVSEVSASASASRQLQQEVGGKEAGDAGDVSCAAQWYDWKQVQRWKAGKPLQVCAGEGEDGVGFRSSVVCKSVKHPYVPDPQDPTEACELRNVVVHAEQVRQNQCYMHRPGYLCETGTFPYFRFFAGSVWGNCQLQDGFSVDMVSKHMHRDFMDGLGDERRRAAAVQRHQGNEPEVRVRETLVVLARERREHANLFHTVTELFNAFVALELFGVARGNGTRVLFLDDHPRGRFDGVWERLFSPAGKALWLSDLLGTPPRYEHKSVLLERAVMIPPGYSSLLMASLETHATCEGGVQGQPSQLVRDFAEFVMGVYGVKRISGTARVTLVVRRPYKEHELKVSRTLDNEEQVVAALRGLDWVRDVHVVDMAELSWLEQLQLVATTDVLVGMHGAALTHALWLPTGATLVELRPHEQDTSSPGWWCFEHLAEWVGVGYRAVQVGLGGAVDVRELASVLQR